MLYTCFVVLDVCVVERHSVVTKIYIFQMKYNTTSASLKFFQKNVGMYVHQLYHNNIPSCPENLNDRNTYSASFFKKIKQTLQYIIDQIAETFKAHADIHISHASLIFVSVAIIKTT